LTRINNDKEAKDMATKKTPLKVLVIWRKFDKIMNMTPSQIRAVREDPENEAIGLSRDEVKDYGADVLSGREASKIIEKMLAKAGPFRGKLNPPPWTKEEFAIAARAIRYLARARANVGDLVDEEGNDTPKKKAMKMWGRNETNAKSKFPDTKEVKEEIKKEVKQMYDGVIYKANDML
jgi:hypothetical protein